MKLIDYDNNQTIDVQVEEIEKATDGYNSTTKVKVNGVIGYKKRSINCSAFDSFEYLISILAKRFNIKVAETYCFDDGSIFSKSVANEGEEFITISEMSRMIPITEEEMTAKQAFDNRLDSLHSNGQIFHLVKTNEEIEYVMDLFIRMIHKLNIENKDEIIRDYIRMCFLDCITGNKDRVSTNFGLIKKGDKLSFAPLFDNATIAYPMVDDNLIQLNHYFVDRNALLDYIIHTYPDYVEDILLSDIESIREDLTRVSEKILSEVDKKWFDDMVINNILANLSQRKDQGSKIETMGQQIQM